MTSDTYSYDTPPSSGDEWGSDDSPYDVVVPALAGAVGVAVVPVAAPLPPVPVPPPPPPIVWSDEWGSPTARNTSADEDAAYLEFFRIHWCDGGTIRLEWLWWGDFPIIPMAIAQSDPVDVIDFMDAD